MSETTVYVDRTARLPDSGDFQPSIRDMVISYYIVNNEKHDTAVLFADQLIEANEVNDSET